MHALALSLLFAAACDTADDTIDMEDTGTEDPDSEDTGLEESEEDVILAIGDFIMAANAESGASIADVISASVGVEVVNNAAQGALLTGEAGADIINQYAEGDWSWLVLNGGIKDLQTECGCDGCEEVMDAMISEDGTAGGLPAFLAGVTDQGIHVAALGYYLVREDVTDVVGACYDEMFELNARLETMAETNERVWYAPTMPLLDGTDAALYDELGLLPSEEGSALIGTALSNLIRSTDNEIDW